MVRVYVADGKVKAATGLDPIAITEEASTEERRGTEFLTEKVRMGV